MPKKSKNKSRLSKKYNIKNGGSNKKKSKRSYKRGGGPNRRTYSQGPNPNPRPNSSSSPQQSPSRPRSRPPPQPQQPSLPYAPPSRQLLKPQPQTQQSRSTSAERHLSELWGKNARVNISKPSTQIQVKSEEPPSLFSDIIENNDEKKTNDFNKLFNYINDLYIIVVNILKNKPFVEKDGHLSNEMFLETLIDGKHTQYLQQSSQQSLQQSPQQFQQFQQFQQRYNNRRDNNRRGQRRDYNGRGEGKYGSDDIFSGLVSLYLHILHIIFVDIHYKNAFEVYSKLWKYNINKNNGKGLILHMISQLMISMEDDSLIRLTYDITKYYVTNERVNSLTPSDDLINQIQYMSFNDSNIRTLYTALKLIFMDYASETLMRHDAKRTENMESESDSKNESTEYRNKLKQHIDKVWVKLFKQDPEYYADKKKVIEFYALKNNEKAPILIALLGKTNALKRL